MQLPSNLAGQARSVSRGRDLILAASLAILLSVVWAWKDWTNLSRLILPDADDMMRLAQVRDWLAGQAMNDWTQYRMAPPNGAPMHWSRIADLGPAVIIATLAPPLGRHSAELAAVLIYPGLLFLANLFLSARIARRLWSDEASAPAVIIAALAHPGVTIFIPGRIDHHGLQMVLIQLAVLALMRRPGQSSGAAVGLLAGVSLMVGLEAAPQLASLLLVPFALWVRDGGRERVRLGAIAGALLLTTLFFLATMRPTYWSATFCDAFTPASATGTLLGGGALGVMALATPWLSGWRGRLAMGAGLGAATLVVIVVLYPTCVSGPYGFVDPLLQREFLSHIDEANGVFKQTLAARLIGLGGLLTVGSVAAVWMLARAPSKWPVTMPIATVVLSSALVMLAQVRGTYIGAPAAASILAGLVVAARRLTVHRTAALAASWLGSAGVCYASIPAAITLLVAPELRNEAGKTPQMVCNSGDTWREVDRLPPGVVMSPTNMASYMIGSTRMSTVGAGYHRNNAANVAMYHYFLDPPRNARAVERARNVNYVAFCPGDFEEIDIRNRYPASLGAMLASGRAPAHYRPLPLRGTVLRFYRVGD